MALRKLRESPFLSRSRNVAWWVIYKFKSVNRTRRLCFFFTSLPIHWNTSRMAIFSDMMHCIGNRKTAQPIHSRRYTQIMLCDMCNGWTGYGTIKKLKIDKHPHIFSPCNLQSKPLWTWQQTEKFFNINFSVPFKWPKKKNKVSLTTFFQFKWFLFFLHLLCSFFFVFAKNYEGESNQCQANRFVKWKCSLMECVYPNTILYFFHWKLDDWQNNRGHADGWMKLWVFMFYDFAFFLQLKTNEDAEFRWH